MLIDVFLSIALHGGRKVLKAQQNVVCLDSLSCSQENAFSDSAGHLILCAGVISHNN